MEEMSRRCVRQWHAQLMRIPKHRPRSRQFDKRQGDNPKIRFPSGFSHEKVTQNARAAENTGVIVNGAWRGETCCDKQTRRGREREEGAKIRKLPRFDPSFLPFSVFFDGATNLFLVVVAHFLVFGRKRNRSGESAMRRGRMSQRSDLRPFSA